MARNHLIIQLTPGLAHVALTNSRAVIASRQISFTITPETSFEDQLHALRPLLIEAVTAHGCVGARTTIIAAATGASAVFACPFAVGPRGASASAGLALAELCQFPLASNPSASQLIAIDEATADPRQRHVLAAAMSDEHARAIAELVNDAHLSLHEIIPADALVQRMCVQTIMSSPSAEPRGMLWLGETSSVLACSAGGGLRFVRVLSLGVSSLVDALCRPIKGRAPDGTETTHTLTRERARELLLNAGIPAPQTTFDKDLGIEASSVLPILQPVLQRLAVEIKQSLRFGLTEPQRGVLRLHLDGPGSIAPRLAQSLGGLAGVAIVADAPIGQIIQPVNGPQTVTAWPALERLKINLLPAFVSEQRSARRLMHATWGGIAVAAGLVAMAGLTARQSLEAERKQLAGYTVPQSQAVLSPELQSKLLEAKHELRALQSRIDAAVTHRADWGAALRSISMLTPEVFRLGRIEMTDNERGVIVSLAGVASAESEQRFAETLRSWTNQLSSVPIVRSVGLGATGRAVGTAGATHRFELSLTLHALPPGIESSSLKLATREAP